jgi:hypothetical protein
MKRACGEKGIRIQWLQLFELCKLWARHLCVPGFNVEQASVKFGSG